jgi:putative membrane protein
MYYGYGDYGMMGGFGLFGLLWQILTFVVVIWLVVWALRMIFGGGKRHRFMHMNSALSILDERFAKGEIDKAEYEERKKALMS